jgi:hypothetical protein
LLFYAFRFKKIPADIKNDLGIIYSGCITVASLDKAVKAMLNQSGITNVVVELNISFSLILIL